MHLYSKQNLLEKLGNGHYYGWILTTYVAVHTCIQLKYVLHQILQFRY